MDVDDGALDDTGALSLLLLLVMLLLLLLPIPLLLLLLFAPLLFDVPRNSSVIFVNARGNLDVFFGESISRPGTWESRVGLVAPVRLEEMSGLGLLTNMLSSCLASIVEDTGERSPALLDLDDGDAIGDASRTARDTISSLSRCSSLEGGLKRPTSPCKTRRICCWLLGTPRIVFGPETLPDRPFIA